MENDVWMVANQEGSGNDVADTGNTVRLPDGSSVALDPGAQLMLAWSPSARGFVLNRYGALFNVVYNATHPMLVDSGCVRVRTHYGQFRAFLSDDGQVLTVHTHLCRVEVLMDSAAENGSIDEARAYRVLLEPCKIAQFHISGQWWSIDPQLRVPEQTESFDSVA